MRTALNLRNHAKPLVIQDFHSVNESGAEQITFEDLFSLSGEDEE